MTGPARWLAAHPGWLCVGWFVLGTVWGLWLGWLIQ